MPYFIQIKKSAEKDFNKIPEKMKSRISEAILELENDPQPSGSKKLKNREDYRIRIGNYRILYLIDENKKQIMINIIGHRKEVYK